MDVAVAKRLEHLEMGLRVADDYSIRNGEILDKSRVCA